MTGINQTLYIMVQDHSPLCIRTDLRFADMIFQFTAYDKFELLFILIYQI